MMQAIEARNAQHAMDLLRGHAGQIVEQGEGLLIVGTRRFDITVSHSDGQNDFTVCEQHSTNLLCHYLRIFREAIFGRAPCGTPADAERFQRHLLEVSQPRTQPTNNAEYLAEWRDWARQPTPTHEDRRFALHVLEDWLKSNDPEQPLWLLGLGLTSLPYHLPHLLKKLSIEGNALTCLPDNLPAGLKKLDASGNKLTALPSQLPISLETLNVNDNLLTGLPENLPNTLRTIKADRNRLATAPEKLPDDLANLSLCDNRLTVLPESIRALQPYGVVALNGNPAVSGQGADEGSDDNSGSPAARPLCDAVSDWYPFSERDKIQATWQAWGNEAGANAFSLYLDDLKNKDKIKSFRTTVQTDMQEWLSLLAKYPELREHSFAISNDATETCGDRLLLTFNGMQTARICHDVANKEYDADAQLPTLLTKARGMFRLDQLEKIAREKARRGVKVDYIEVYLAYQVALRDRLELPVSVTNMKFLKISGVTKEDLDDAVQRVEKAEAEDFEYFLLVQWSPWEKMLERRFPNEYARMKERLIDSLSGDDYNLGMAAAANLNNVSLDNNDISRAIGIEVKKKITLEFLGKFTRAFLQEQKIAHLLPETARISPAS
ncbi:hypothetical protein FNU76_11885 [Chitinimonas arctica]|uniref:NEL domain-containing protein n=1 Tax=Chitinimonas arctica TaxID=2594795 RepID=A0A516SFS2_9NEIS|nr:NEL-type E3 ubiquitin ligase domain-containing protein [Chitinimonas arctica]QDQ27004.1 hypothetical protein FNU76_11885 [Chitinimonas arctica]